MQSSREEWVSGKYFFLFLHKNICCGYIWSAICFHGEIRKNISTFGLKKASYQELWLCTCVCTASLSLITHVHSVLLTVTKCIPIHFVLNPGHAKHELGIQMVWKFSQTPNLLLASQEHYPLCYPAQQCLSLLLYLSFWVYKLVQLKIFK